jgi:hypothetical protein
MTHGKNGWVCDPRRCPKRVPENSISYQVEKRYLTTATIMFLTSAKEDQDPEEFSEIFASRLEELTEEIVSFDMQVVPLSGGFVGHEIIGSELVPKKVPASTGSEGRFLTSGIIAAPTVASPVTRWITFLPDPRAAV